MRNRKTRIEMIEEEITQLELEFENRIGIIKHHLKLVKEQVENEKTFMVSSNPNEWTDEWLEGTNENSSIPDSWKKVFKDKLDEAIEESRKGTGIVKPYVPVVTVYGCPMYEPFTGKPLYETEPYIFSDLEDIKDEEE